MASSLTLVPLWVCAAALATPLLAGWVAVQSRQRNRALAKLDLRDKECERLSDQVWELRAAAEERDRAEAASVAKSRFLATVSHEVRTPLSGILGLADLLAGTTLTGEQKSYVSAVKTSGGALMTLIDDILDFARIEAGRLELASEPFDIAALVEGVVELLAPRAQGKGLEIASFVTADVPPRLLGDAHRLRQILLNLAGNAVKFTERGGVGVAVARRWDGAILFSVSDTGPGVQADRRSAIFEEFEQADGSMARQHGGAGLGLAITKRIVAEMGGELGLQDRDGGGSLFVFSVPLPAPEEGVPPVLPLTEAEAATHRALVVSPETFQGAYLAGALAERGSFVRRVSTFVEAAAFIRTAGEPFDVVFVDCAGGAEEARAIAGLARLAGVRRTVLLVSPFEKRALGDHLTTGFDGWLVKPIRRASLIERLHEALPAKPQPIPPPPQPADPTTPIRVLLAEDNPINALIARTSLERFGAQVTHAENGAVALQAAEAALASAERGFDLVMMDVCMPTLDGLEATRRIRAAERRLGAPPAMIVATTAHAFDETRRDCEAAGMDDVWTKPIDLARLRQLVADRGGALAAAS